MNWPFDKREEKQASALDPKGQRLLGLSMETGEPIWAPKGHSLLLSANGGGKSTCGGMVWLYSYAASEPRKAVLVLDSKNGEAAVQAADMLAAMGRKAAIIDDMGELPPDCPYRVSLNPFGAAVSTALAKPDTLTYVLDNINHALIPEPAGGDDRNLFFRALPRNVNEFGIRTLLRRNRACALNGRGQRNAEGRRWKAGRRACRGNLGLLRRVTAHTEGHGRGARRSDGR